MRKSITRSIVALLAALALSQIAMAQGRGGRPVPDGFIREGVPAMPNPPGPAPKRDLSGAWVGPNFYTIGPIADLTPAGRALFEANHRYLGFDVGKGDAIPASNDPFITCDPLGFPRNLVAHAITQRGGVLFGSAPNRIIIAYEQQRVWREIWMDGRALPKQVDARGAPESRYYGYSVGRWDGDHTLVIDTTGVDDRTWLDEDGYPRSSSALIQERYTRVDQYNIQFTVTVDDPKFYTKPFQFMKASLYWMKDQMFAETFCIPSEGIQYRDSITAPSGIKVLQ